MIKEKEIKQRNWYHGLRVQITGVDDMHGCGNTTPLAWGGILFQVASFDWKGENGGRWKCISAWENNSENVKVNLDELKR